MVDYVPVGEGPQDSRESRGKQRVGARRRRVLKMCVAVAALVLVAVVAAAGVLVRQGTVVAGKVFKNGSIFDLLGSGTPLRTDGSGRTNILLFGTSQDDHGHSQAPGGAGLWLTDSIQLVSLNQRTHRVTMIAIPRDTWVHMPKGCIVGTDAKINAVYECAAGLVSATNATPAGYAAADAKGATALMQTVSSVTGLTSQYSIHVDYSVLRDSVNALGGISVDIVGDGGSGVVDMNLGPTGCSQPTCSNVYYPRNGTYHLSGTQAMDLARARGDANPLSRFDSGLDRGDFDREANQQKIMVAIKERASAAGTLANPVAIFKLMGALGSNVTTSLSAGEAKSMITFASRVPAGGMGSISLTLGPPKVLTTGVEDGQDVVLPTAGLFDWAQTRSYVVSHVD